MSFSRSRLPISGTFFLLLTAVVALGAFLFLDPGLFPTAASTETPVAPATSTPLPTLTPTPTETTVPIVPPAKARTPGPLPAPGDGAQVFNFVSDPTRSGYLVSGDDQPHWGERNLHVGSFNGQRFQSALLFDLKAIPPDSKILYADLLLTGLSRDNLGAQGTWTLKVMAPNVLANWNGSRAGELSNAPTGTELADPLTPQDLDARVVNQFVFRPEQFSALQQAIDSDGLFAVRLDGPTGGDDNLFTWDGGGLNLQTGAHPQLRLVAMPGQVVIVTNTPMPENVMTAAAFVQQATKAAAAVGTPTSFPRNYVTATPIFQVTAQPTPENIQTRVAMASFATAVALTTGTFTPTPVNWVVVTAQPTALPTFTPTPTPTLMAVPIETVVGTLTPNANATIVYSPEQLLQTPVPDTVDGITLRGNILFLSDRFGKPAPLVMSPDGTVLGALTGMRIYNLAFTREPYSPDRTQRAIVEADSSGILQVWIEDQQTHKRIPVTRIAKGMAYDPVWSPDGKRIAYVSRESGFDNIFVYDLGEQTSRQITHVNDPFVFTQRPSWSPDSSKIVFKSNRDTGLFQIWTMNTDGSDQHPLSPSSSNDSDPIWIK